MKQLLPLSGLLFALVLVGASCQQNAPAAVNSAVDTSTNSTADAEYGLDEDADDKDEAATEAENPTNETTNKTEETITKADEVKPEDAPDGVAATGAYTEYNTNQVASAAANGDAVLFFHAPWCPTCAALNKDIEANQVEIPAGLTIFKTDYDSELELRKKYGVTYQHTLVQVDANGNLITKWSGGSTLESIVSKVQ